MKIKFDIVNEDTYAFSLETINKYDLKNIKYEECKANINVIEVVLEIDKKNLKAFMEYVGYEEFEMEKQGGVYQIYY